MKVILIGARASGKSTVGRLVAKTLSWPFIDLDEVALSRFKESTIAGVWKSQGEAAWRQAELRALQASLTNDDVVLSLGGGTPTISEAFTLIQHEREHGACKVVYLRASVATLRARLRSDAGDRPSLTGGDLTDEVERVLKERERPYYVPLADEVIDTDDIDRATIAGRICEIVKYE